MTAPRRYEPDSNPDMVNHPPHYDFGPHETIDVIEAWGLPYHLGNVVKYVSRAERKGKKLEDLKKAAWYLNRYIEMTEREIEDNSNSFRLEDYANKKSSTTGTKSFYIHRNQMRLF